MNPEETVANPAVQPDPYPNSPQRAPNIEEKPPPLPQRTQTQPGHLEVELDPSSPIYFARDPHRLTVYIVPFPKPNLKGVDPNTIPTRFLIYTPPPPPLPPPAEGEKEGRVQKIQRKWQDEVREAKTSDAKVASWKGIKGRATKGIDFLMSQTKSSNLEFLNRIPVGSNDKAKGDYERAQAEGGTHDHHAEDGHEEGDTTKKTVGLGEMLLVYPTNLGTSQDQLRDDFINSMMRTKSKAQKDAVLATGLIPVTFAIDVLATVVWPFGGLVEIDAVWAAASVRGAKTARTVTKRLNSTGSSPSPQDPQQDQQRKGGVMRNLTGSFSKGQSKGEEEQLHLAFAASTRTETLCRYLASECHMRDRQLFVGPGIAPTDTEALDAIGWTPSQSGGQTKNWEDEQWETREVKEDLKMVMHKGAREWDKWCKAFAKDPEKALKK